MCSRLAWLSIRSHGDFLLNMALHPRVQFVISLFLCAHLVHVSLGSFPQTFVLWSGGVPFSLSSIHLSSLLSLFPGRPSPLALSTQLPENTSLKVEGLAARWHSVESTAHRRTELLKTSLKSTHRGSLIPQIFKIIFISYTQ